MKQMSALTEVSEADELKAAVAATGEPRLIALLERLAVVEGKLAEIIGSQWSECRDDALQNPLIFGDFEKAV